MIRKPLKVFAYSMAFLLVCSLGLVAYLVEPWVIQTEVMATGKRETIQGLYGLACGEEFIEEFSTDESSLGKLVLVVPEGGIAPEETRAAVKDNLFVLAGYRYKIRRRNVFTGKITETRSPRFDVVAWHVVRPYRVFENGDYKQVNTPLGWTSQNPEALYQPPTASKNRGC